MHQQRHVSLRLHPHIRHLGLQSHEQLQQLRERVTQTLQCVDEGVQTELRLTGFVFVRRNILDLTNAFDVGDKNITGENYDSWLRDLNASDPDKVSRLNLTHCDLQNFLDQVNRDRDVSAECRACEG